MTIFDKSASQAEHPDQASLWHVCDSLENCLEASVDSLKDKAPGVVNLDATLKERGVTHLNYLERADFWFDTTAVWMQGDIAVRLDNVGNEGASYLHATFQGETIYSVRFGTQDELWSTLPSALDTFHDPANLIAITQAALSIQSQLEALGVDVPYLSHDDQRGEKSFGWYQGRVPTHITISIETGKCRFRFRANRETTAREFDDIASLSAALPELIALAKQTNEDVREAVRLRLLAKSETSET